MSRKLIVLVLVSVLLAPVALAADPFGSPQGSWLDWLGSLWSSWSPPSQHAVRPSAGAAESGASVDPNGLEEGSPSVDPSGFTEEDDTTSESGPAISIGG